MTGVTAVDQDRIADWERRTQWVIFTAAFAPFIAAVLPYEFSEGAFLSIDLASWLVFLIDLIVHVSISRRYLLTGRGLFDLTIVVLTFPWYVFPAINNTRFMSVLRLARLLRVFASASGSWRLRYIADQMGGLIFATAIGLVVAALIVIQAEPPESGFETWGDALWWGVVTLTTVGYGDFSPVTQEGRLAALLVMALGIAVLGTLAGVLAALLSGRVDPEQHPDELKTVESQLERVDSRLGGVEARLEALQQQLIEERPGDQ